MSSIQAPKNCPSCSSELVWKNHILYCQNANCICQVAKKVEHFAKTLKIKGLGPAAVSKLALESFDEIYNIDEEYIAKALNSKKLAMKLKAEIDNSKKVSLNQLLPAFSIRLIGRTAASKLSYVCNDITEIDEETCAEAGLGPKATANLMAWLSNIYPQISELPFSFAFEKVKKQSSVTGYVCLTGKLKSFKTKAEATAALMQKGYIVKGTLTKQVTILVNESGVESSKTKQARESGVTIITNLYDFIGE